jgi:hypothetical protein
VGSRGQRNGFAHRPPEPLRAFVSSFIQLYPSERNGGRNRWECARGDIFASSSASSIIFVPLTAAAVPIAAPQSRPEKQESIFIPTLVRGSFFQRRTIASFGRERQPPGSSVKNIDSRSTSPIVPTDTTTDNDPQEWLWTDTQAQALFLIRYLRSLSFIPSGIDQFGIVLGDTKFREKRFLGKVVPIQISAPFSNEADGAHDSRRVRNEES